MAKLEELATITWSYTAPFPINTNFGYIADAFDNTLSRDGSSPNHMLADIDLNSYKLRNVGDAVLNSDAVNLGQVLELISADQDIVLTATWGDINGDITDQADLQSALANKAGLASPSFTGSPTAPTPTAGDNSAKLATTSYVQTAIAGVTGGGGDAVWGSVTGDINTQTDLQIALNEREPSLGVGTTSQYLRGDKTFQTLNKAAVGLGNVDNTSDANKPVSTAQQTALNSKADLASPAFTGNPTAPTQTAGNNSTRIATTAFVQAAIAGLGGGEGGPAVWGSITGTLSDQTDLQTALDSKADDGHTHTIAEVTNLQTTLDAKASLSHTHTLSDITNAGTAAAKNLHVGTTAPSSPATNDLWVDTN